MNWKIFIGLVLGWLLILGAGCQMPGQRLENAMADSAQTLARKIQDEGVLQDWMMDADGHVQDPGLESYVSATFASGVRARGINGNIIARGHGDSTRLPAGTRETLLRQLDGPISDEQRTAILTILGWNRAATPGGP